ncbi:MAG: hypothetical protein KBC84_10325, partial [Proteobacteria bacterium]|nr:hypothetical protein [Pseudomonadota bacterium]
MATIDYRKCLTLLLKPIVAFSLRHGLKVPDLIDVIKSLFIELSLTEIAKEETTPSVSKISAMTGLHRKFIPELQKKYNNPEQKSRNVIARILGQWQGDRRFKNKNGKPKVLGIAGLESEFAKLVFSVSADLNPFTILAELIRMGVIEKTSKG